MELGHELAEQLEYFDYTDSDRELLAGLASLLEKNSGGFVAAFYRHLLSFEPTRRLLTDPATKERLLVQQRNYLLSLAGPKVDEAYVRSRRAIGEAHERIGLDPSWYLGAYSLYLSLLTPLIFEEMQHDPSRAERTLIALQKLNFLDARVAIETYMDRRQRDLAYLNRELARSGHRLAREFEQQSAELRQTTERARAAERLASLGTLVAGLAHEIGTPMGVIQGHAKLLEASAQDEKSRWRLQTIRDQVGRISRIIQSLLHMARPSRSRRIPLQIESVLEGTLSFLSEKFQQRSITVSHCFDSTQAMIGDPERLQQLFLNLFLNAADAMPEGGELRVALSSTADGVVEVRVVDNGSGIAAADLPKVFDPFFTSKPAGEGNGLGLAVAQGIVTDHGGTIEVTSSTETGSEFKILFPPYRGAGSGDSAPALEAAPAADAATDPKSGE